MRGNVAMHAHERDSSLRSPIGRSSMPGDFAFYKAVFGLEIVSFLNALSLTQNHKVTRRVQANAYPTATTPFQFLNCSHNECHGFNVDFNVPHCCRI